MGINITFKVEKRCIDEFEAEDGTKIVVEIDESGEIIKATADGKQCLDVIDVTDEEGEGKINYNGGQVLYMSPGTVIITKHNPVCYTRKTRSGRTKRVCYG